MATTKTTMKPPHKRERSSKVIRPDDDQPPKFLPVPSAHASAPKSPPISPGPAQPSNDNDAGCHDTKSDNAFCHVLPPELQFLTEKYSLASKSIISSSKIEHRVSSLLNHLSKFSFADLKSKPGVLALYARATCANKLVTVIEIVKREVTKENGKLYQYSRISSELLEIKEKPPKNQAKSAGSSIVGSQAKLAGDDQADEVMRSGSERDEETSFQTMEVKQRKKVRAVPVMTVYLSRVPVPELREKFGEQINK